MKRMLTAVNEKCLFGLKLLGLVGVFMSAGFAGATEFTWALTAEQTGSAVNTASDWTTPANWGVASGCPCTVADFAKVATGASGYRYIRLPDALTIGRLYNESGKMIFVGNELTVDSGGIRNNNQNTFVYANLTAPNDMGGSFALAGDIDVDGTLTISTGNIYHRADRYATSTASDRKVADIASAYLGWNAYMAYSVRSQPAKTVAFNQTDKSPYLFRSGSDDCLQLAVGTTVTGEGIPEGTFLRRIFSEGVIELSNPVSGTRTENALSFAAFKPTVRHRIGTFEHYIGNVDHHLYASKYVADEGLFVEIDNVAAAASDNLAYTFYFESEAGMHPGTYVFHNTGNWKGPLGLKNTRFLLAGDTSTSYFPNASLIHQKDANVITYLQVTNDMSVTFHKISSMCGQICKEGTGSLATSFSAGEHSGTLVVKEGTLELQDAGGTAVLGGCNLSSGATLHLATGSRISLKALTAETGAMIVLDEGATLCLTKGLKIPDGVTVTGKGAIEYAYAPSVSYGPVYTSPIPRVVGNPAFWIDAASLTGDTPAGTLSKEDGTTYLSRWNDRRDPNGTLGYHFATNIMERPRLYTDKDSKPFVHIPGNSGVATRALAWDVPIENIRAVFAVLDVSAGQGSILGTTMRIQNPSFLRAGVPLCYPAMEPEYVKNAPVYVDGVLTNTTICPNQTCNRLCLLEIHPTADGAHADAFSIQDSGALGHRADLDRATSIYEYVIYTNELTYAERCDVAKYLYQKWVNAEAEPAYTRFDARQDFGSVSVSAGRNTALSVAEGDVAAVDEVTGSGGLEKRGAGTLHVLTHETGDLSVAEGTLCIRSVSPAAKTGAYLHLDATATNTLTTVDYVDGTKRVTNWKDCDTGTLTAKLRYSSTTNAPRLKSVAALGGKPVLDFGRAAHTNSWSLPHNSTLSFTGTRDLKTIFTVIGSAGGGNTVLGGTAGRNDNYDTTYIGIWRDVQYYEGAAAIARPIIEGTTGNMEPLVDLQKTEVKKNGVVVNQSKEPMSGNYDLISVRTKHRMASDLIAGIHYGQQWGGVEFGEIAYYATYLSQEDFDSTEAYLRRKWFGVTTQGFSPAAAGAVTVAADATLEISGGAPLSAMSLGGAGLVKGSVSLTQGAVIPVTVEDAGSIVPLTVQGTLDMSKGGTVELSGALNELKPGEYPIAKATGVAAGDWTVSPSKWRCREASVKVRDGTVYVVVRGLGLFIVVQ